MRFVCIILHLFGIYVEKRNEQSDGLIWFICFSQKQITFCRQAIACAAPRSEGGFARGVVSSWWDLNFDIFPHFMEIFPALLHDPVLIIQSPLSSSGKCSCGKWTRTDHMIIYMIKTGCEDGLGANWDTHSTLFDKIRSDVNEVNWF